MNDDFLYSGEGGLELDYRLGDGIAPHYFIFNKDGSTPGTMGEEIARIDMRDGTVTYSAPDAGRDAARVFWEMFGDYIKEQIALHKKSLDGA